MAKDKLWGGRFAQPTNKFVEEFTASIDFDKRLYHQDIRGSLAHARMLGKQGIIPLEDVEQIDSLGITLVLGLFKSCQKSGIKFSIQGVNPDIMRVFKLFNLPKFFPVIEAES